MSLETKHFYEFGDFRIDLSEKVLLRDGKSISVTPKVFETLCVLMENAGRTVEKDELMQRIWDDRFVEESNLTFNVGMLRKALGDDAGNPTFIKTVPRRGYRFIAEVREVFPETKQNAQPGKISSPRKSYASLAAVVVLLLATRAAGSWMARKQFFAAASNAPILSAPFHSEKFSASGKVGSAAISPDGKFVAFADETAGKYGVWLRRLESSENIQIVAPSDEDYGGLAFAHDGQTLFFMRKTRGENAQSAVYRVPTKSPGRMIIKLSITSPATTRKILSGSNRSTPTSRVSSPIWATRKLKILRSRPTAVLLLFAANGSTMRF